MEQHEGGPREWEARAVRPKNEPRFPSWFVFSPDWKPRLERSTNRRVEPNAGAGSDERWTRRRDEARDEEV
jgi:hypothetical protein